jgi:ESX secretion system protein EccD
VHADDGRADLALSATLPIESLIPPIVDILATQAGQRTELTATRYQLSLPGDVALTPWKTLAQLGIRDGSTLLLTSSSTVLTPPRLDDAAEAVSVSLAAVARPWTRRTARLIGALSAGALAGTTAAIVLGRTDESSTLRGGAAAIAAVAGLLALLAAAVTYRVFRDETAGLTLGLMGCGFAAVAGWLAVPGAHGAPNALLATAATATAAAVVRITGCCAATFTALACFASIGSAAAVLSTVAAAPLPVIGAASATTSLIVIEAAAPVSMKLTGLASHAAAEFPPPGLSGKALRANAWLTSLITGFCAAAALGAMGAAAGSVSGERPAWLGTAFAALTGGVLLLRARAHHDLARSVPLLVAGTATLAATLVIAAIAYPRHTLYLALASTVLAAAALSLGFFASTLTFSPVCRRSVELLEYFALATVVPMACWICGVYGAARGMNL